MKGPANFFQVLKGLRSLHLQLPKVMIPSLILHGILIMNAHASFESIASGLHLLDGDWEGCVELPFAPLEVDPNTELIRCIKGRNCSESEVNDATCRTLCQEADYGTDSKCITSAKAALGFTVDASKNTLTYTARPQQDLWVFDGTGVGGPRFRGFSEVPAKSAILINFFDHLFVYNVTGPGVAASLEHACENTQLVVDGTGAVIMRTLSKINFANLAANPSKYEISCDFTCEDEQSASICDPSKEWVIVRGEFKCTKGSCSTLPQKLNSSLQPDLPCKKGTYEYECNPCMKGNSICDCGCFNEISGWDWGDCDSNNTVKEAVNAMLTEIDNYMLPDSTIDNPEAQTLFQLPLKATNPLISCKMDKGIHCLLRIKLGPLRLVEVEAHAYLDFPEVIGIQAYVSLGPLDRLLAIDLTFGLNAEELCASSLSLAPTIPILENLTDSLPSCSESFQTVSGIPYDAAGQAVCNFPYDNYKGPNKDKKKTGNQKKNLNKRLKSIYNWLADLDICASAEGLNCSKYKISYDKVKATGMPQDQWLNAQVVLTLKAELLFGVLKKEVPTVVACAHSQYLPGGKKTYMGPCYSVVEENGNLKLSATRNPVVQVNGAFRTPIPTVPLALIFAYTVFFLTSEVSI
eukprot:g4278.t1